MTLRSELITSVSKILAESMLRLRAIAPVGQTPASVDNYRGSKFPSWYICSGSSNQGWNRSSQPFYPIGSTRKCRERTCESHGAEQNQCARVACRYVEYPPNNYWAENRADSGRNSYQTR